MKLTGVLRDRVDAAQTKAEKKAIIAGAGMELTDAELEGVTGGGCASRFDPQLTNQKPQAGSGKPDSTRGKV